MAHDQREARQEKESPSNSDPSARFSSFVTSTTAQTMTFTTFLIAVVGLLFDLGANSAASLF